MARIVEQVKFPVPKFKKQINTAAYARVSSGKDAMLHSLSAQVSYYSDLIQKILNGDSAVFTLMKP